MDHSNLSGIGLLTSILIGVVASVTGVDADATFWRTTTWTETAWSTQALPPSTVWNTETYTETAWSTYVPPAVTISIPYTVTSVLEKDYTKTTSIPYTVTSVLEKDYTETTSIPYPLTSVIEKLYTDIVTTTVENNYTMTITETSLSVSVVASLATKYSEYSTTLTSVLISVTTVYQVQSGPTITQVCTPVTINQPTTITISPTTVTINQPTTITISPTTATAYTTSSVTGLVLCPSRTINPTYTTSTPLPGNYTWGCPPGTLCKPPQINCNFEQNPPADTYYCSPEECVSSPPLPSFNGTGPVGGSGCGPFPNSGYFNFDPDLFGLSFSIFIGGGDYAPSCVGCGTTAVVPVSQISDGQPQAPTLVPVCEMSDGQPQAPQTTVVPVSTISDGQPQGPVITTAARLAKRADQILPATCYQYCDECLIVAESYGKSPKVCPPLSTAYGQCGACISGHQTDTRTNPAAVLRSLDQFTNYCSGVKNAASPAPAITGTTTSSPSTPTSSATTKTSVTTTSRVSIQSTPTQSSHLSSSPSTISSPSHSSSSSTTTQSVPTNTPSATKVSTASSSKSSQPLAVTTTVCAVSQISDGQPQECTSTATAVSQISDGQPQAPTTSIATFTGAAGHTLSPPNLFWSSPMGWALLLVVNAVLP